MNETPSLSPFGVFRNRNFTFLWTGQLVSTVGNSLTDLAAAIYIYRITGSALSVGLMLMATALPGLLIGLVAGVVVDRYNRKRIMIATDVITAEPTQLLRVTADTLRHMSGNPELNRIFMNKMTERMVKLHMIDLPRYGGLDQSLMRELRTPEPQPVAA